MPDLEDPDSEDNLPIPLARTGPSKLSARYSNRATFPKGPIDDGEDCVMLEVLNVAPISFAYPMPSMLVDSGAQPATGKGKGATRKRSGARPSNSKEAERAAKKQRTVKKTVSKPAKKKPTSDA